MLALETAIELETHSSQGELGILQPAVQLTKGQVRYSNHLMADQCFEYPTKEYPYQPR